MSDNIAPIIERAIWPERIPVDRALLARADAAISRARAHAAINDEQTQTRQEQLRRARTYDDVRSVLVGIPHGEPPLGLTATRRVVTVVWLAVAAIQFVVWALVCAISGSMDTPWWSWELGAGAVVIVGLWLAEQRYHRADEQADRAQREFADRQWPGPAASDQG